jgi:hypothetical protein
MGLMVAASLVNLSGSWLLAAGAGSLPALGWTGMALLTDSCLRGPAAAMRVSDSRWSEIRI